jgi:hypothetical protein
MPASLTFAGSGLSGPKKDIPKQTIFACGFEQSFQLNSKSPLSFEESYGFYNKKNLKKNQHALRAHEPTSLPTS